MSRLKTFDRTPAWPRSRRQEMTRGAWALLLGPGLLSAVACGGVEPRDLGTLVVRDSLYVDPASGDPYSGPVHRPFAAHPDRTQVEGGLLEGAWHGEFRVYHPNGRVRYMGSFHAGSRCGAWTENADSLPGGSVYEELLGEIESLGMYPPCPDGVPSSTK